MAWDRSRNLLYVTTATAAGYLGNSLVVIDPATATVQNSAYVGSEPRSIALAGSDNTMHIALEGPRSAITVDSQTLATTRTTPLVDSTSSLRYAASSVTAVPGSDTAFLAVRTRDTFVATPFFGTVAYDQGVPLPAALSDSSFSSSLIAAGDTSGLLYQWSTSFSRQLVVDSNGIGIGKSSFNSLTGGIAAVDGDDAFTPQGDVYQFGQSSSSGQVKANGYPLSGANSPSFGFSSDGQTIYSLAIRPGCTFGSYVPCDVYPDGVRSQLVSITATDRQSLAVVGQYSFSVPNTRLNVTGTFDVLPAVQLSVTDNEIFLNFRSWITRIPLSAFAPAPISACEVNSFSMNPNPLFASQSFTPSFTLGGSVSCSYEIRIGSPSGRLITFGEPGPINRNVSTPVSDGDLFYLQRTGNTTDGGTLATLKARVRTTSGSACTASGFSLLPGPIFASTPLESLFFSGSTTCPYEIRSGTPSGPVVASGIDGFISARPNAPLSNGLVFYLQQAGITTPVGTMASVTVQVSDPVRLPCSASTLSLAPVLSTGATSRLLFTGTAECSFDIRAGSPTGRTLGSGSPGSVQLSINAEVSDGDKFFLQRSGSGSALGTMAVATARVRDSYIAACNVSQFGINPSPIYTNGQFGTGTLSGDVSCNYDIRVNSPDGSLFTWGNGGQFSWQTGNWVSNNMVFYLQARGNQTAAGTLATAIAKVKNSSASSCTVTNFGANPNPIRTNGVFGSATITGSVTCPYDIRIGNANGPIFAGGPSGAISATTGAWITDGMSFYLQTRGDGSDAGTLAVFTAKLQPAGATSCSVHGLAANPNPIRATGPLGSTTLVGTSDCPYDIRIGKPDGSLFAAGQRGNISAATGAWVSDGMTFYVQAQNDGTPQGTLGVITARVLAGSAAAPCNISGFGMKDSPVRTNDLFGATTLTGTSDCSYDIRVGSPDGNLFASRFAGTINAATGRWISEGMTFYLQPSGSTDPNATLAITQATLQQAAPACVVGGFFADPISGSGQFGSTTLTGQVDCDYDIRVGTPSGVLFATGQKGAIAAATGAWVSEGMVFYLQTRSNTSADGTLAVAKVTRRR